jgi:hypothetical protein
MTTPLLENYPSDVLLEIIAHLNLNDVLSLLSVSITLGIISN